jgi:hypothetical protein
MEFKNFLTEVSKFYLSDSAVNVCVPGKDARKREAAASVGRFSFTGVYRSLQGRQPGRFFLGIIAAPRSIIVKGLEILIRPAII